MARIITGQYPYSPSSYLLQNNAGNFKDITALSAPEFKEIGMVTSAVWTDYDQDEDLDLIVVGEWMDIQFYKNSSGKLTLDEKALEGEYKGWWNIVRAVDLDNDGDDDYVVGNLGENYKYKASDEKPFEIFGGDLDQNGTRDIVVGCYSGETLYPVRGFQCSSEQMPQLKQKFESYEAFGNADVYKVYGSALDKALHLQANYFKSAVIWNNAGKLELTPLPAKAQLAPIQDIAIYDYDKDGDKDLITAGNWYVSEVETPRADSGTGLIINNIGNQKLEALSTSEAGFFTNKDVRQLAVLDKGKNPKLVVANNNDKVQLFKK